MQPFYDEGLYSCLVTGQSMGESSTGKPQFVLRFKVIDSIAENGEQTTARQQYERSYYRSITEKTAQYFAADLRALGYPHNSFRQLDTNAAGFHSFEGQTVEMFCTHETDQKGEARERWGVANSKAAATVKPLPPQKLRELDNLFGKHLQASPRPAAPAPVAAPAATPATACVITDDDIPF